MNPKTGKCISTSIVGCNRLESGLCTQCKPGYRVTTSKTTCNISCSVRNCNMCTNRVCTECVPGFNLTTAVINEKTVQVCVLYPCTQANCTLCNSTGSCIKCKSGFLLNSTSSTCYANCTLITNCISCSTNTTCIECIEGRSWNQTSKICQIFTGNTNCRVLKNSACTSCKAGYTLSASFQCLQNC